MKSLSGVRTSAGAVTQTAAGNILIQIAYVASGIITARALGPGGRGSLAAIIMWPQFLSYALTLGVPIASVYQIRRHPETASAIAAAAIAISIVMGVVAALVGFLVIPHALHTYPFPVVQFARRAIIIAPIALLGVTLSSQVQSSGQFGRYNLFRVAQPVMVLVVLAATWGAHELTAFSAALAYLFAGIPITIVNLIWVWRHFHPRFGRETTPVIALLSYGLRVWGADLLGTVANQVDRILVVGMLAPEFMGLYIVSQSVAGLLNVLPSAMCTVLMPKAAGRSVPEIVELTGRAARLTLVGLVLSASPLFFAGERLLSIVYGHKYDGAGLILKILLGEAILDGLTAILAQAFLAAGVPGTLALLEGCGLFSAIPLMYWMIPRWGLRGAAYALLCSTALRLAFVIANFRLKFKVTPPSLLLKPGDFAFLSRSKQV